MAYILTGKQLADKMLEIATEYKTVYMYGAPGMPMTEASISAKAAQYPSNNTPVRVAHYRSLIGKGYWGFDCVNIIKAILWGWKADYSKTMGGAVYASNGVPDTNANGMINLCLAVTDAHWNSIPIGAAVWSPGHIGIYIGGGLAVEATPTWANKVQLTAVGNIKASPDFPTRTWDKWGLLPWIDYAYLGEEIAQSPEMPDAKEPDWRDEFNKAWERAIELKIIDGTNPQGAVTREQLIVILDRLGLLEG